MTEVAVADKPKVILVGGMDYNVPQDLKDSFEIVRHITQGSRYNTLPQAQYVFVLTQWANHKIVDQVKRESKAPVVWLPQGWAAMKEALQKRSLLPPDAPEGNGTVAPASSTPAAAPSTLGMSHSEIWKKFGDKMVEAARAVLNLGQSVTETELLEALALAGPPPEDCKHFLPRLQMLGVVVPTKNEKWRLASTDTEAYEAESDEEESEEEEQPPVQKRRNVEPRGLRTDAEERLRLIPGNPALVTRLLAGLKEGPYPTKRSIYVEMKKYKEFAGLSEYQVKSAVERAIDLKIVDDSHKTLSIAHQDDLKLTLIEKKDPEPVIPEVLPSLPVAEILNLPPSTPPPSVGLTADEAHKKWSLVVERIHVARQRIGDILHHCRTEWMGTNKVLVIMIPPALASCQKFLESMENWGVISRTVQEHFTRDTVVRFMLDNGLRS